MKKLYGYDGTYYPERWSHNGWQICKLTDRNYLIFDDNHEVIKCCDSLDSAEDYIEQNL